MYRDAHRPGETVPQPGVYWVHHYQHRLAHPVWISAGTFAPCGRCGDMVRFKPAEVGAAPKSPPIQHDVDFHEEAAPPPAEPEEPGP